MQGDALAIGRSYAFREKQSTPSSLLKVKLINKVGRHGKLKVRFEDGPRPGLEDYIKNRQLVVRWKEGRNQTSGG